MEKLKEREIEKDGCGGVGVKVVVEEEKVVEWETEKGWKTNIERNADGETGKQVEKEDEEMEKVEGRMYCKEECS